MPVSKKLKTAALVIFSYLSIVVLIFYCALAEIISLQQAGLMLVAEFGLYVGFGILIAVYRMISKLD